MFISLLHNKGYDKYTGEWLDEQIHRQGLRGFPVQELLSMWSWGVPADEFRPGRPPTPTLLGGCSKEHNLLLTPFPAPLPSLKSGRMGLMYQVSHHHLVHL